MGVYTFELDDRLIATLKQWVIGKHGKLRKRLSKTVERAIREFLEREMQKEAERYRKKIVGKVDRKLLDNVLKEARERAEKGRLGENTRELSAEEIEERIELLKKNPREFLKAVFGEQFPKRIAFSAFKNMLRLEGFNDALVELIFRNLLDARVYIAEGNLLIYNPEGERDG